MQLEARRAHLGNTLYAMRELPLRKGKSHRLTPVSAIASATGIRPQLLADCEAGVDYTDSAKTRALITHLTQINDLALPPEDAGFPPGAERENAFYAQGRQAYQTYQIPLPAKWEPPAEQVEWGMRGKAIREALDNGQRDYDKNPGSQISFANAAGYSSGKTSGYSQIERGHLAIAADRRATLYHHLGIRDDEHFASLGDAALETERFRREHFSQALATIVENIKPIEQSREAFAREKAISPHLLTPQYFDTRRGANLVRQVLQSFSGCIPGHPINSEADIYAAAGLRDFPEQSIRKTEMFVKDFYRKHDLPDPYERPPALVSSAHETFLSEPPIGTRSHQSP
jgi:hypothetical protein